MDSNHQVLLSKDTYNICHYNFTKDYNCSIQIFIETSQFILKTAQTNQERYQCFRLRHEVFSKEYGLNNHLNIDYDEYDDDFSHLIIIDKKTTAVVGTYRFKVQDNSHKSYTNQEFDLESCPILDNGFLELGRACIHKDYRRGITILPLLWRGILEVLNKSKCELMIGCSSVKTTNVKDALMLKQYFLENNFFEESLWTLPKSHYIIPEFLEDTHEAKKLTPEENSHAVNLIPPLLKAYLKYGAKINIIPALDLEFKCIDFLTLMKSSDLNKQIAKKLSVA
jgi:putative hemolysin